MGGEIAPGARRIAQNAKRRLHLPAPFRG